jgi:murein L,D-transpeptidase YcbB/YkuD
MRRWSLLLGVAGIAAAAPALAQETDVAPVPPAAPAVALMTAAAPDSSVAPYYSAHPGALIWLRDATSRAAAAKLVEILRRAPVDGLDEGPALASAVESALASGLPAGDRVVSAAWLRYVEALDRPVAGISYGDPALALTAPSAQAILEEAARTASLVAHVERVSAVNPLYSTLREQAASDGSGADPHVRATLDRLRLIPARGRAILVDVANARLLMLEDGQTVDTMKVIVGKRDFPTPLIAGTIHYVTFNPYWHIPQDVARRKVAPIVLKRGVSYLKAARYQTVSAFGYDNVELVDPASIDWKAVAAGDVEVNIRQLTGPNNMMGKMKFGFVNDYGIFLHDTPHKELFKKARRNLSLGCVRVEHPERLAQWLLGREPDAPADDAEQLVRIDHGVPIYISYLTATVEDGQIAFADDVYGLDEAKPEQALAAASAAAPR